MALRINTNVAAFNTLRSMWSTDRALSRSLERLSSGLRVNRAADDAAGLSLSEGFRSQVRGDRQAARNILDAISALQAADGALAEVTAILQRMRELAVQSANGVYADADRASLDAELVSLQQEVLNIAANTTFNGFPLVAGAGDDWVTSPVRTATATLSPLTDTTTITARQDLFAATPRTAVTNNFAVDQRQNMFTVDPTTTDVTLSAAAEQYGLGVPGPQSIVVTLRDTTTGITRTIPYDATNGFTYDAATRRITLNGSAAPAAGEDQLQVDYVRQGALNFTLSSTPIAGSAAITVNGVPVAQSATNGYTITGNTLRLNGNARPTAGVATAVAAAYDTATTFVTLTQAAEQYGLGVPGPTSIVVTLRNPVTGVTRTLPYDATNGFTYTAASRRITFNGTAIPTGGETQVQVDYIRQGSTALTLSSPPIPGSETITANGSPVAEDPANGYTLTGSTVRLNGTARPSVGTPMTLSADYLPAGTTTLTLDSTNPFFGGVTLNQGSITILVDGVPQAFTEGVDYTVQQVRTDMAGLTPLYSYTLAIDNAVLAAAGSTANPTIAVDFTVDYPTTYGPFGIEIQSGANDGEVHTIRFDRINLDVLGIAGTSVSTQAGASAAIAELDGALTRLAETRGLYGADVNRLQHAYNNVTNQVVQMEAAESRIRDVDMAEEMSRLTRQQILMQGSTAMLQEANIAPSQVLSLITP